MICIEKKRKKHIYYYRHRDHVTPIKLNTDTRIIKLVWSKGKKKEEEYKNTP